jgi:mRNA degradation ribonuclease J1/J2
MNGKDISQAKNPDLRASLAAMHRAAELARQTAIETNTAIIMVRDGQIVRIPDDELRKEDGQGESEWCINKSAQYETSNLATNCSKDLP